jgi:hypothetical protein
MFFCNLMTTLASTYPISKSDSTVYKLSKTLNITVLGIVLSLLQILDGVLTAIGISFLGTSAEGNILLRGMMDMIGYIPTLFILKLMAIGVIYFLCSLAEQVKWIPLAMTALIFVYTTFAVIPWTVIIGSFFL